METSLSIINTLENTEAPRQFLSQIITDEDLNNIKPGRFNILSAPRGWGKTTFMFDERILNFARAKKHIVYLVHTKNLRDSIHILYPDVTDIFELGKGEGWLAARSHMWSIEKDRASIQLMCYQTFAALLRRETEWLEDIDLIVWDEFDDVFQYYQEEIKRVKKEFPDLEDERIAALLQEGKHTSICSFIYQIQSLVLEPARIRLLAISATPEAAAPLFGQYVNYILYGKLQEIYDAKQVIYIESIAAAVNEGLITPNKNMCPWVFTQRITNIMRLAEVFRAKGFHVLTFWALDNPDWRAYVTPEIKEAAEYINTVHYVPPQYDCVITNQVAGRGIDIFDERFQDWLCDSLQYSDIGQFIRARYAPARKYLLNGARGLVEFVREEGHFPAVYYMWHTKEELKDLLISTPIYDKKYEKQLKTWLAVKKEWEDTILFEDRKYGAKHMMQYRITGIKEQK